MKRFMIRLRRKLFEAYEWLGPWAEAIGVLLVGSLFLIVAVIFDIGSADDWAAFLAASVLAAVTVFFIRFASRQHAILIEVTLSFLVNGGKAYLDNLLGKLISGRWKREHIKPGRPLFEALERLSRGDDWEIKRRIAEALPALGRIDSKRAIRIVGELRDDWDTTWRGDLRRRAVEALALPAGPRQPPLLARLRESDAIPLLSPHEKDEVYTLMALIEAAYDWPGVKIQTRDHLIAEVREYATRTLAPSERSSLDELVNLLEMLNKPAGASAVARLKEMAQSKNEFVRISAARNAWRISHRFPESTLYVMDALSDASQPRNVRRPIAKERSVGVLLRLVRKRNFRSSAKALIRKLLVDEDKIIRVTAFDMVEALRRTEKTLCSELCALVVQNERSSPHLMERAQRLNQELDSTE